MKLTDLRKELRAAADPARARSSGLVLYRLARSRNLWERRIAIVSTLTLIRPRTTLRYAIERFPPARRKKMLAGVFAR
jgi:hypothetical protein